MPGRVGGGLDALNAMPPQNPDPLGGLAPAPNPGPADPYNHAKVQKALDIIEANPNISVQMMQTIMNEALGPAQAQIASRQQTRSDITSGLTGLAQGGTSLEGAQGFVGANYPGMAAKPFVGNALDSLYGGQQTSPLAPLDAAAAPTGPLPGDDQQSIDAGLQAMVAPQADGSPSPYTLHDAIMHFTTALRLAGAPPETIEAAKQFIEQRWAEYRGWESTPG